jgi:hypothetical protein
MACRRGYEHDMRNQKSGIIWSRDLYSLFPRRLVSELFKLWLEMHFISLITLNFSEYAL